ncbi:putative BcDTC1, similar to diterpene cyclase [Seiridium unicorne]|uniref:BcDTC1, similar to diterpene cyclase n=1 Tax=Seiridium unicorne TaxID=138068 RepID=A0ABR2UEN5_9PEZI
MLFRQRKRGEFHVIGFVRHSLALHGAEAHEDGIGIYVATTWLFPECFEFVLARQLPSGAWESYTTPVDGILNTAAALLSVIKHLKIQPDNQDCVLGLLEKEEIFIEFPQLSALRAVRDAKLAKIPSSTVYKIRSTLYHSLEAFIGYIDFDKVGQWQEANGSFMDSRARDNGGVPSAWPTTVFEISWVVTTLATIGVSPDPSDSLILRKTLQEALEEQKGLLGFAIVIGTPCKDDLFLAPDKLSIGMRKTGSLLAGTPLIRDTEPGIIELVELQACFALQALQRQPPDIFPRTAKGKDKYIFIIPLALLRCAEVHGCSISFSLLYEMMVLSILNFHADEYMEGVIEKHFSTDLDVIRGLVGQLFTSTHSHAYSGKMNGNTHGHSGEAKTINQSSETSELFTNGSSPTTFDLEQQHDSIDRPSVNGREGCTL